MGQAAAKMNSSAAEVLYYLLMGAAAWFLVRTGAALPEAVASHFNAAGVASGYMSRSSYVHFMLVFVVALPLTLNFLVGRVLGLPDTRINIPHREYWLAPERRADTALRLQRHMKFFGVMLAAFFCYVHWQVVQANSHSPPALDNAKFSSGLATFMAAVVVWIVILRRDFRPPQQ